MRLKELREDLDIPQRIIAEYLGIRQNTYSQYENGQRQLPIEMLIKLSKYFNTEIVLEYKKERKKTEEDIKKILLINEIKP